MGNGQSLQQIVLENWISTFKRMKDPYLTQYVKIISKWIKDPTIRKP
jgi:hypothetical protein